MKVIEIEVRSVYGNDLIYPVNDGAKALARIAGKKTLSISDLQNANSIGLEVVEVKGNYGAIMDLVDKKFASVMRSA